jgi:hypothetical protein
VTLARVACIGTTVRSVFSPIRFSSETWLPF